MEISSGSPWSSGTDAIIQEKKKKQRKLRDERRRYVKRNGVLERVQSSFRELKGMDWPKMYRTSSSFLALPVTKVTGRERINPDAEAPAAAICPRFLEMVGDKGL